MTGLALEYLGHSAFVCTAPDGTRIAIDPYGQPHETRPSPSFGQPTGSRWFVTECPMRAADAVLVTHPHFDHDAVQRIEGRPNVVRHPGRLAVGETVIDGHVGTHAGDYGREFGQRNIVFVLESGAVTLCHPGDNRAELPASLRIGERRIDTLIVPVDDGCHLLGFDEVERLVGACAPRVVIPVHHHVDGLTHPESTLGPIERWLAEQSRPVRPMGSRIELSAKTLPSRSEVWTMRPAACDPSADDVGTIDASTTRTVSRPGGRVTLGEIAPEASRRRARSRSVRHDRIADRRLR